MHGRAPTIAEIIGQRELWPPPEQLALPEQLMLALPKELPTPVRCVPAGVEPVPPPDDRRTLALVDEVVDRTARTYRIPRPPVRWFEPAPAPVGLESYGDTSGFVVGDDPSIWLNISYRSAHDLVHTAAHEVTHRWQDVRRGPHLDEMEFADREDEAQRRANVLVPDRVHPTRPGPARAVLDPQRLRVLDLFSGLNGWGDPFREAGYEVFAIDNDTTFTADAYLDIGDVTSVLEAVPWQPDIIFASPPCNSYSTGSMGKMWAYGSHPSPKRSDRYPGGHPIAIEGMRLVSATLRLIAMLQPRYWVIENPRGRLRSLDLLAGIPRVTVWYCRLGLDRAKPTDLWGVFPPGLELPPECNNGNPDHIAAPRGSRTGTQGGVSTGEAGCIPRELAERFRRAIETEWREGR